LPGRIGLARSFIARPACAPRPTTCAIVLRPPRWTYRGTGPEAPAPMHAAADKQATGGQGHIGHGTHVAPAGPQKDMRAKDRRPRTGPTTLAEAVDTGSWTRAKPNSRRVDRVAPMKGSAEGPLVAHETRSILAAQWPLERIKTGACWPARGPRLSV